MCNRFNLTINEPLQLQPNIILYTVGSIEMIGGNFEKHQVNSYLLQLLNIMLISE